MPSTQVQYKCTGVHVHRFTSIQAYRCTINTYDYIFTLCDIRKAREELALVDGREALFDGEVLELMPEKLPEQDVATKAGQAWQRQLHPKLRRSRLHVHAVSDAVVQEGWRPVDGKHRVRRQGARLCGRASDSALVIKRQPVNELLKHQLRMQCLTLSWKASPQRRAECAFHQTLARCLARTATF